MLRFKPMFRFSKNPSPFRAATLQVRRDAEGLDEPFGDLGGSPLSDPKRDAEGFAVVRRAARPSKKIWA
jgi:hypothetical protein